LEKNGATPLVYRTLAHSYLNTLHQRERRDAGVHVVQAAQQKPPSP
jgi:hypothetical protein